MSRQGLTEALLSFEGDVLNLDLDSSEEKNESDFETLLQDH